MSPDNTKNCYHEITCKNYDKFVEELESTSMADFIFRGQSNDNYKLVPSFLKEYELNKISPDTINKARIKL